MRKKVKALVLPDAPLQYGDRGMDAERLQLALEHIYKLKGKKKITYNEPSYFGLLTMKYLVDFQQGHMTGIPVRRGVFDKTTRQIMREVLEQ